MSSDRMDKPLSNVYKISILTLGQGINIIVSFLFMPYMSRALSIVDYGTYGQTILVISLTSTLLAFGLSKIIFVYLNQKSFDSKIVLFNNLINGIALGAIGSIFLYLSSNTIANWFSNSDLTTYIQIYSLSILFSIPSLSINSFLIFRNKIKQSVKLLVFSNVVKILLVVLSIQFYHSLTLALIGIVFSELIRFLIGIAILKNQIVILINKSLIIKQMKAGFPLGLTSILGILILYTDGLMVSKILGIEEYAIYRNGALEVPFIATIYGSIATIIMPEIAKLWPKKKYSEIRKLKFKTINYTAILIYPVMIFFLLNAKDFIILYLGERYQQSAIIFMIFNLTLFIRINDYSDALIASGNTKYILYSYLITLIINIILNYYLIDMWGSKGAAISTVLSIFILAALQFKKTLIIVKANISDLINFKILFQVLLFSVVIGIISKQFSSIFQFNQSLQLIITTLIYFPFVYFVLSKLNILPKEIIKKLLPFSIKKKD